MVSMNNLNVNKLVDARGRGEMVNNKDLGASQTQKWRSGVL